MSDEHLDKSDLARSKFGKVLESFHSRGVEEIISCGDHSMNGNESGWDVWTEEIANSPYYSADEIHSCLGNHELYPGVATGWRNFIQYDNDGKLIGQDKAYYSEEILGDKFIFMAIDISSALPETHDCFTDEQITWATNEIENYSGTGNVWIVQHAYINNHGPGDSLTSPGYRHGLNVDGSYSGNNKFYSMLCTHSNVIFIHGHSHIRLQDRDSYGLCVFSGPTSLGKEYTWCYSLHVPSLNRQKSFTSPGICIEDPCNDNSTFDKCEAWICKNYEDRIEFQGIKAYTNTDIPNMHYTIYK